ncbi:hypothetical protein [Tsuneonella suprasediminis]|uniref:hypothetical protein n=1 Tax=Tsuneonella suprasediminis TaxID=2306996 RepID=UPI002F92EA58
MRAHPQSLVDRAELLARSHDLKVVAELLGLQPSQITAMKKRGWKEAISGRPMRPMPGDFAWMASRMTFGELATHYRAGNSTIKRWLREAAMTRRSRKGDHLRIDPATGLRGWEAARAGRDA